MTDIVDTFLIEDLLDDMVWSFSRLNGYYTCPRMWYLTYIKKIKQKDGFFGSYGTFMHEILEEYDKGNMELFELSDIYKENFMNKIPEDAPPNRYVDIKQSYFDKGLYFLENFKGYDDETLGVEKKVEYKLDLKDRVIDFIGYIDRLSKDDNGYNINDHKSKSMFKNEKEKKEYLRQLYLYSIPIFEEFGEYPKKLKFNMFKENVWVVEDFNLDALNETKDWVRTTLDLIYSDKEFLKKTEKKDDFFCKYICGCYEVCIS